MVKKQKFLQEKSNRANKTSSLILDKKLGLKKSEYGQFKLMSLDELSGFWFDFHYFILHIFKIYIYLSLKRE